MPRWGPVYIGRSGSVERLRRENRRLRARVGRAAPAPVARRRDPTDLRYLFVVTYGRSGSTLLMGVLNAIPGFLVRGENWDALHHLFEFHRLLQQGRSRWAPQRMRRRTHPFFGAADYPTERALRGLRELVVDTVLRPRADTRVAGFKEIRWHRDDLEEYAGWLREVFPGARFVVNTRDHAAVLRSGWWAREPDGAHLLDVVEARILALADHLGADAYRVHYDDWIVDPSRLRGLFDWLGEEFDEAAVRTVLDVRHSVGREHADGE